MRIDFHTLEGFGTYIVTPAENGRAANIRHNYEGKLNRFPKGHVLSVRHFPTTESAVKFLEELGLERY